MKILKSIRIEKETISKVEQVAATESRSFSAVVNLILSNHLNKKAKAKTK